MTRAGLGELRKGGSFALFGPQHLLAPHRYTAASVIDTASKYKLLWKLPLEDADIIKGGADSGFLVLGSSSEKLSGEFELWSGLLPIHLLFCFGASLSHLVEGSWLAPTELDQDLSTQTTFCLGRELT